MGNETGTAQGTSTTAPAGRSATHRRIALGWTAILTPLMGGLVACGGGIHPLAAAPYDATAQLSFHHGGASTTDVDPDQPLRINTEHADSRITDVIAADADGRRLPGELSADGGSWRSTAPLAADARYTVRVSTENGSGSPGEGRHTFATRQSDVRRLTVAFGPEPGTYGVGQPLVAELNRKVRSHRERALVESNLQVTAEPTVSGSWHWADDRTLHYRPRDYWPTHADITVRSTLDGVHIRDGLRGGATKPLQLRTGDRVEAIADVSGHAMTVLRNGKELRTIPITTGKAGFRTRGGKKVILSREEFVRMRSSSVGIPAGSSDSYDLPVQWATRLTLSGEYVHGAPWSVGSQGNDNVSHGCTGLSTEHARWFFNLVKPGDIVEHVNALGEDMAPFGNGYGDWNLSWDEWRAGSALQAGTRGQPDTSGGFGLRLEA